MISKSTQGLVRSQTVESCQVIPSACQSDGVEEGPLVYGIEIVFSKEEWNTLFRHFNPAGGCGTPSGKATRKVGMAGKPSRHRGGFFM